jgi:uncharacterized membrane protein YagU involved in acid resistance
MGRLIRGAAAGVVATGLMSAFMLGARALGLIHRPPPKTITARAQRKVGIKPHEMPQPAFTLSWLAAHVAYGMSSGVVYALLRPVLPKQSVVGGLIYGEALWAVSYLKLMPELGLYPSPKFDSPSRTAAMIAAHAVYGTSVATVAQ